MRRLVDQPDADMMGHFAADFCHEQSRLIRADLFGAGMSLWTCGIRSVEDAVGYWIGSGQGPSLNFFSYLALVPIKLGEEEFWEAKKAWTQSSHQRQGLGKALLLEAIEESQLLSDRDGMTQGGFGLWKYASGINRRYFDCKEARYIEETDIPRDEFFFDSEAARRWQMVLSKMAE